MTITGKPEAKDLSRFYSEEAKSRQASQLKGLFKYVQDPKVVSLGGGLPLSSLFPFDNLTCESLAPNFPQGINQDILTAEKKTEVEVTKKPTPGVDDIDLAVSLQYGQSEGDVRLRDFIKEHTKRVHDIAFENWDLLLTCGNTFGWDATLRTFTNRGDRILAEEFAFSSAIETARANGVECVGVKMDLEGIDPVALENQMANWTGPRPKLLYTVPTGQNPTGSSLSAERRAAVYKIAQKYDFLIIEDEPYYYLQMDKYDPTSKKESVPSSREAFVKSLVPSFMQYDTDGRVVRLDTFSKVLAPGTRIGWIVAQKPFIERYLRLLETSMQVPSGFSQSVVNGLLQRWGQDGYLDWLMELRKVYTHKRDNACDAIIKYLPKGKYEISPPVAGMFFWLKLDAREHVKYDELGRNPVKVEEYVFEEALKNGVLLVPGHWFSVPLDSATRAAIDASPVDSNAMFFRGTFASVPDDKVREGMERFSKSMTDMTRPIDK